MTWNTRVEKKSHELHMKLTWNSFDFKRKKLIYMNIFILFPNNGYRFNIFFQKMKVKVCEIYMNSWRKLFKNFTWNFHTLSAFTVQFWGIFVFDRNVKLDFLWLKVCWIWLQVCATCGNWKGSLWNELKLYHYI